MEIKTYIVDSFTKEQFKGNPAGVCLLEYELKEDLMLSIAQELGLSETAFVTKTESDQKFAIRYFSPKKEIPLCGHATLAAAKVLFRHSKHHEIHFINIEQLKLVVRARQEEITMEFPVYDTIPFETPAKVLNALGLDKVINTRFSPKNKIILLEIEDALALSNLKPDFNALLQSYADINGVLVTARSSVAQYDYQYRYFWPWSGTNEDPVTGGVQTFLGKYWSEKLHKKTMQAFQSSARTGSMTVEVVDDKVFISGHAVIVFEGVLTGMNN